MQNGDIGKDEDKTSVPSFIVVNNGKFNRDGLNYCGKTEKFISKTLKKNKTDIKKVLVMICDKNGKFTIVEKE
ncbi:MAG: hypothetical protein IJ370_05765 [Oscillospiraceae bacterium]|nr:hypothetical protein [Oscillospiraceae bacterium]